MKKSSLALIICLLVLASCSQFQNPEDREHYTGLNGVDVEFASGSPPQELFVRGEEPVEFPVDVRVRNKGASLAKGGVYLSGYDPTIIDFEEIDEEKGVFDACEFTLRGIEYGSFDGFVQCKRLDLGALGSGDLGIFFDEGDLILDLGSIGLGELIDNILGADVFTGLGFNESDIMFDMSDGRLDVDFHNPNFDPRDGARGKYFLSVWSPIRFDLNQGREFLLRGDTPSDPGVKEEFITFNGNIESLPSGRDRTTQPLMVTSCYLYTTYATPTVCIDPDPYSDNEKTCRPGSYTSSRGQGAPLAITSVVQRQSGGEMVFEIQIENLGGGQVYNPMKIQRCSPYNPLPVTEEDTDVVVLGMVYLGDQNLECYPQQNTLRLYNGKGKINCVYDAGQAYTASGYETNLVVELWYGYSETVRRDVEVQRI